MIATVNETKKILDTNENELQKILGELYDKSKKIEDLIDIKSLLLGEVINYEDNKTKNLTNQDPKIVCKNFDEQINDLKYDIMLLISDNLELKEFISTEIELYLLFDFKNQSKLSLIELFNMIDEKIHLVEYLAIFFKQKEYLKSDTKCSEF